MSNDLSLLIAFYLKLNIRLYTAKVRGLGFWGYACSSHLAYMFNSNIISLYI